MEGIVSQVLVEHLDQFKNCRVNTTSHRQSDAMAMKSNCVALGLDLVNPGTLKGMVHVMDTLTPMKMKEEAMVIHGDAATVLMLEKAKLCRGSSVNSTERLDTLRPVPGEFHRRMLHLQDTYNLLFNQLSFGEVGTLANVKSAFHHKSVTAQLASSFNHCEHMLHSYTKALVVLTAIELLERINITSETDQQELLKAISKEVTSHFWHQPSMSGILEAADHRVPGWVEDYSCKCKVVDGKSYKV